MRDTDKIEKKCACDEVLRPFRTDCIVPLLVSLEMDRSQREPGSGRVLHAVILPQTVVQEELSVPVFPIPSELEIPTNHVLDLRNTFVGFCPFHQRCKPDDPGENVLKRRTGVENCTGQCDHSRSAATGHHWHSRGTETGNRQDAEDVGLRGPVVTRWVVRFHVLFGFTALLLTASRERTRREPYNCVCEVIETEGGHTTKNHANKETDVPQIRQTPPNVNAYIRNPGTGTKCVSEASQKIGLERSDADRIGLSRPSEYGPNKVWP